jgi:hypothetical protein
MWHFEVFCRKLSAGRGGLNVDLSWTAVFRERVQDKCLSRRHLALPFVRGIIRDGMKTPDRIL